MTVQRSPHRDDSSTRWFILGCVGVAIVLAVVVSSVASGSPDGLERVAKDKGFAADAVDHPLGGWVFADYETRGVDHEWLSTAITGLVGVLVCFAIGYGLVWLARRRPGRDPVPATDEGGAPSIH